MNSNIYFEIKNFNHSKNRVTIPARIRRKLGINTYRNKKPPKNLNAPILFLNVNGEKFISPVYLYRGQITIRKSAIKYQNLSNGIRVGVVQIKSLDEGMQRRDEKIVERNGAKVIDLLAAIPQYTVTHKRNYPIIIFETANNLLMISYRTRSGSPEAIALPRYLRLDRLTCQIFGLYLTDGSNAKGSHALGLTNNDPTILRHFLNFFEKRFGIPRNMFKAKITANQILHAGKNDELTDFWSRELDLTKQQFQKTTLGKTATAQRGAVSLTVDRRVLKEVFTGIIYQVQNELFSDYHSSSWILQGVMAGDGFPQMDGSVVRRVVISATEARKIEIYKKLLQRLEISFKWRKDRGIDIVGIENLRKLSHLDVFCLHQSRNERFTKGFSRFFS